MKYKVSQKKLREFGLLIGFMFPLLLGLVMPSLGGHSFRIWTLWVGIPSAVIGVIRPNLLFYPYKFWMKLGNLLGWLNSRIILGLVFFIVLVPISFIMKITGHDPLRIKKTNQSSYKEYKKNYKIDLKRIF